MTFVAMLLFLGTENRTLSNTQINLVIEAEIMKCGKSAYLGLNEDIFPYLNHLKKVYPRVKFGLGKQPLPSLHMGWTFGALFETRGSKYFKYLIQAGIYKKISEFGQNNEFVGRTKISKGGKRLTAGIQKLTESLLTVFIALGFGCLAATGVMLVEISRFKLCINFISHKYF